jgi:O-antigen/teichoic acid export membrane protein
VTASDPARDVASGTEAAGGSLAAGVPPAATGAAPTPAAEPTHDIHGKGRLARNIFTNWGAQAVQMVAGFVLPRMIDHRLGQATLGVWDLAWSLVVYFGLVQVGVTASINRYVAYHRAKDDFDGINRVLSSIAIVMRVMGAAAFSLAILFTYLVGPLFRERLGPHLTEARWLVLLLGLGLAVQISATVYSSILTGLHRWDWHNGIHAATNVLTLAVMVGALLVGQGVIGVAVAHVAGETLGRSARMVVAYRLCPWLEIKRRHFRWETAREMLGFGGKAFLTYVSQLLMNSSVSLLIAGHLGPAALALYQRPVSLVRNFQVFVNKYAMVFSPTISSFQGAGRRSEVVSLALKATRYGIYLSLPVLLLLVVFGSEVMRAWMGGRYANGLLVAVVVAGLSSQISYIPLYGALVGLNLHGAYGVANLIAAATALLGSYVALGVLHTGVLGVAVAVSVPLTIVSGIYLPVFACRRLEVSARAFWREVWRGPVLCALPYLACLVGGRLLFRDSSLHAVAAGVSLGGLLLAIAYWRTALPERWKARIRGLRLRRAAP